MHAPKLNLGGTWSQFSLSERAPSRTRQELPQGASTERTCGKTTDLHATFEFLIATCNNIQGSVRRTRRAVGKSSVPRCIAAAKHFKHTPVPFDLPKMRPTSKASSHLDGKEVPKLTFENIGSEQTTKALSQTKREFGTQDCRAVSRDARRPCIVVSSTNHKLVHWLPGKASLKQASYPELKQFLISTIDAKPKKHSALKGSSRPAVVQSAYRLSRAGIVH